MSRRSPSPIPLCTSAENPPMKSTPTSSAARSSAMASGVMSHAVVAAASWAMGVTAIRLLTMGMPNSRSIRSATGTRRAPAMVTRS